MNIYEVMEQDTKKVVFRGTTDEIMDKYIVTRDTLFWHVKNGTQYAGYFFVKVGSVSNKKKKATNVKGTETNKGLDKDLAEATKLGMTYGQYKEHKRQQGLYRGE